MKERTETPKKQLILELTRHRNFIDGRVDIFDVLAAQKVIEEKQAQVTNER